MALFVSATSGEQFDDGLKALPGEDGFTRDLAAAHFGDEPFNYVGTPNWEPPVTDEEPSE